MAKRIRMGDLGSGSGTSATSVINGLTIPTQEPFEVHVIDNDPAAIVNTAYNLQIASEQAPRPVIVDYSEGDYLQSLQESYDYIFFNPPYLERGHNITHDEALMAPSSAIFTEDSTQEYRRVVPSLREHLVDNGMAIIRLPREDRKVDAWVKDYINNEDNHARLFKVIDKTGREGRFLGICVTTFPDAFATYDYSENYLGDKERRMRARSNEIPFYHDDSCEILFIRKDYSIEALGARTVEEFYR